MPFRLIARLDVKPPNLIKGVHLEGLRVMGDPAEFAERYAKRSEGGADELLVIDAVASLYGRNQLTDLLDKMVQNVFIPVTVGGGIRSLQDFDRALRSGADRAAINTAALKTPSIINEIASRYGSQAIVVSIEAKRTSVGAWECFTDNGREKTGRDVRQWVSEAVDRGAGEILLTSVDMEGTRKGFDLDLIRAISPNVPVPVIASGGCGSPEHVRQAAEAGADAVAVADCLHYNRYTAEQLRGRV